MPLTGRLKSSQVFNCNLADSERELNGEHCRAVKRLFLACCDRRFTTKLLTARRSYVAYQPFVTIIFPTCYFVTHESTPYDPLRGWAFKSSTLKTVLDHIVQELCESRGGRPALSVLTSLLVSVDVKLY